MWDLTVFYIPQRNYAFDVITNLQGFNWHQQFAFDVASYINTLWLDV